MTAGDVSNRPIANRERRLPLWAVAVTAGLVLLGFRPQSFSSASSERDARRIEGRAGHRPHTLPEILVRSWKQILLRIYQEIVDDRVIALAAGVTFYTILAIFPAIAAFVALYGLFADAETVASNLDQLSGVLPGGAIDVIGREIDRLAEQQRNALSLTFLTGLGISLWSANAGVKSLFDALNLVYDQPEKRSLIRLNAVSLAFTAGSILFLLIALAGVVVIPATLSIFGLGGATEQLFNLLRWPVLLILIALALALVYRYGPSRRSPRWRWISWGSALAALGWLAVSILFSWYAANFGSFNKTYGSLGAVIGFMVWIWLSTTVILIGAEVDAELDRQTGHDEPGAEPSTNELASKPDA